MRRPNRGKGNLKAERLAAIRATFRASFWRPTCPSARRDRLAARQNQPRGLRLVAFPTAWSIHKTSATTSALGGNQGRCDGVKMGKAAIAKWCDGLRVWRKSKRRS